ncbi:MAG: SBBP repeat-containing protein, partial [Candidatus Aminicenantes bacterium]|nr:SBBP repeat-containing protein [Candidatus Aminicenantes bacterium]
MGKFMTIIFISIIGIMFAPDCRGDVNINFERTIMNRGQSSLTISPGYGNTPLYFIPNKGQVAEKALFYAKTPGYTLWLTKKGLVFDSIDTPRPPRGHPSREGNAQGRSLTYKLTNSSTRDVSHLVFIGANSNPEIAPVDMTRHRVNYFMGKDKSKWRHNIPTSKAVRYKNIYKNIDLKIYGIEKQIEYDWIVKSGGNPADIRFEYKNVKATRIDNNGNLIINTEFGKLIHKKPVSYQVTPVLNPNVGAQCAVPVAGPAESGRTVETQNFASQHEYIDVRFKKIGKNTYGFSVSKYDKNRPLIIDPVVQLCYSTYLGGNRWERGYAIAVDGSGSAYITGYTDSNTFPTRNAFQPGREGSSADVFITKFTPAGNALEYSTYLGGGHYDVGYGIAVDDTGCAYITGYTYSKDFPTAHAIQNRHRGGNTDLFISKLSADGGELVYSTYLGGGDYERAFDIAVDGNGHAYVTGYTYSRNFPTKNPVQEEFGGGYSDAFVTKLSLTGSSFVYSTYLGGYNGDRGTGIAVDSNNCAYITGNTKSFNFPLKKPYQSARNGDYDSFVSKLSSDGSSLLYSTYLGGSRSESHFGQGADIAVDKNGNAYVTGWTNSPDFPIKNASQDSLNSHWDAYVTKFTADGSDLEYSTYIGGNKYDYSCGIAVDDRGCAYIAGSTSSTFFPIKNAFQDKNKGGIRHPFDTFVTKLSSSGSTLIYSTFFGSHNPDYCYGIAVDRSGCAYITGSTSKKRTPDFPTKNAFQKKFGGGGLDGFVAKLTDDFPPTVTITSPGNGAVVCGTVRIRAEASDDVGIKRVDFYIDGELIGRNNHAPYYYDWESFRFQNGSHAIKAEAVDTVEHKTTDEIMVKTQNVILTLSVERKQERAWLIRREYAKIDLNVNNPGSLVVKKYVVYRKESGSECQSLKEIPGAELTGGSYSFNDTYLEKDKTYYYKTIAFDSSGDIIGVTPF